MSSMIQPKRRVAYFLFSLFNGRLYMMLPLLGCLCAVMLYITGSVRAVYIRDGDIVTLHYTFEQVPEEIVSDAGITLMAFDALDFTGFAGKVGEINITRSYPVYLTGDGVTRKALTTGQPLHELMSEMGIEMGPYDELSHNPEYILEPGEHATLHRVHVATEIVHTPLPYETEHRYSSLLRPGQSRIVTNGQNGLAETTVSMRVVDGAVVAEELVEERVIKQPVNQVVLVGSRGTPVSNLDFGVELGADGKPIRYKEVLRDQVATGYNAGRGAWGASGMTLSAGYVAVRADEIPYGTKLYITSEDGSFVYGYAIAADTGTGLMQNIIDVDLYYDTYTESRLNGRRNVLIYVLE